MNKTKLTQNFSHLSGPTLLPSKQGPGCQRFKSRCQQLLALANIQIDGSRPWDIQVHNDNLYPSIFLSGSLGLGEAYIAGWWDCDALDQFFFLVLRAELDKKVHTWKDGYIALLSRVYNLQKISRAFEIGHHHYNIGNDLFEKMLDKWLIYSCGYWKNAETLEQAQEKKLDLVCQKLRLKPGQRLLDIGCGWGGMSAYAARKYGVEVTGITVSQKQAEFAKKLCKDLPVTIELKDYRNLKGCFDRIVSIGMFEHVGYKNYRTYMQCMRKMLQPDGLALLHTIGGNISVVSTNKWINRYIFPNSMIPSARQITTAAEGLFIIEDWHNFGTYYDKTLMQWFENFDNGWESLKGKKYDQRFYRMWKYYLLSCAGAFRARKNQLWQLVLSPEGCINGYCAPR